MQFLPGWNSSPNSSATALILNNLISFCFGAVNPVHPCQWLCCLAVESVIFLASTWIFWMKCCFPPWQHSLPLLPDPFPTSPASQASTLLPSDTLDPGREWAAVSHPGGGTWAGVPWHSSLEPPQISWEILALNWKFPSLRKIHFKNVIIAYLDLEWIVSYYMQTDEVIKYSERKGNLEHQLI